MVTEEERRARWIDSHGCFPANDGLLEGQALNAGSVHEDAVGDLGVAHYGPRADRCIRADGGALDHRLLADDHRPDQPAPQDPRPALDNHRPFDRRTCVHLALNAGLDLGQEEAICHEKVRRPPHVLPPSLDPVRQHAVPAVYEPLQAVGEFELAAERGLHLPRCLKEKRGERVRADDGEVAGRVLRFLHEAHELPVLDHRDPEPTGILDLAQGDHGRRVLGAEHVDHARHSSLEKVVAEVDEERLVPHELLRAEDGVGKPLRLGLDGVRHAEPDPAPVAEALPELGLHARADHDRHVADSRLPYRLQGVLDHRPSRHGEEVLGLGVRERSEPRSLASAQDDGLHDGTHSSQIPDPPRPRVQLRLAIMTRRVLVLSVIVAMAWAGWAQPAADLAAEAETLFSVRYEPQNLERLIAIYEVLLSTEPGNVAVLAQLAQLWYERSTFVPEKEKEVVLRTAADYGFRSLGLSGFDEGLSLSDDGLHALLARATDPATILWTAHSLGLILGRMNPFSAIPHRNKMRIMYDRVIELDPSYYGGSAPQAVGALLANLSDYGFLFGVKLADAKFNFEWAILLDPTYLENHVAYAWEYARRAKDRALFEDLLHHVLEAPIGDWPFWNRHAKEKAAEYLADVNRLFR